MANPSVTTTYTVTVADANGCSDTASVTVNVDNSPGCGLPACVQPNPVPTPTQTGNTITMTFPANPHNLLSQLQYRVRPNQAGSVADMGTRIISAGQTSRSFDIETANCGLIYQARIRYQCVGNTYSDWKFKTFNTTACASIKSPAPELFGDIDIFPNPVSDRLQISFHSPEADRLKIEIYDLPGKQHLQQSQLVSEGGNVIALDTPNLVDGVYFVRISSKTGEVIERFVVTR